MMSIINQEKFNLKQRKEEFLNAGPFPHLVIDDFLDSDFFRELTISSDKKEGKIFSTGVEYKKWISLNSSLPGKVAMIVASLNSKEWLAEMKALTGIESLITTDVGNTKLANFHGMDAGAYLGPHVDHSHEPNLGYPHVLNIIVFLTKDWDKNYGGGTMLFDKKGKKKMSTIEYKENRAIIFLHTPHSFHGVERVSELSKNKRHSIYVDYYSESFMPYEDIPLAFDRRWFKHGTTFKLEKFTSYLEVKNFNYTKSLFLYNLNKFKLNCCNVLGRIKNEKDNI